MRRTGGSGAGRRRPGTSGPGVVLLLLLAAACGDGEAGERATPGEERPGAPGDRVAPETRAPGNPAPGPGRVPAGPAGLEAILERSREVPGPTRSDARTRHGPPVGTRVSTVPNRHVPGATDTIVRLRWREMAVRYHVSGANGKELLSATEVTGAALLQRVLGPGLRGREALRARFGRPDTVMGGDWVYRCCPARGDPSVETLRFRFEGDTVESCRAGFYVD